MNKLIIPVIVLSLLIVGTLSITGLAVRNEIGGEGNGTREEYYSEIWAEPNSYDKYVFPGEDYGVEYFVSNHENADRDYKIRALIGEFSLKTEVLFVKKGETQSAKMSIVLPEPMEFPAKLQIRVEGSGEEVFFWLYEKKTGIASFDVVPDVNLTQINGDSYFLLKLDFDIETQDNGGKTLAYEIIFNGESAKKEGFSISSLETKQFSFSFFVDEVEYGSKIRLLLFDAEGSLIDEKEVIINYSIFSFDVSSIKKDVFLFHKGEFFDRIYDVTATAAIENKELGNKAYELHLFFGANNRTTNFTLTPYANFSKDYDFDMVPVDGQANVTARLLVLSLNGSVERVFEEYGVVG